MVLYYVKHGVACGAGTANPFEVLPVFSGVRVARSLVFCVMFCRSLVVTTNENILNWCYKTINHFFDWTCKRQWFLCQHYKEVKKSLKIPDSCKSKDRQHNGQRKKKKTPQWIQFYNGIHIDTCMSLCMVLYYVKHGVACGAGTTNPSGVLPVFSGVRVARSE
jgi:hypothetical protein